MGKYQRLIAPLGESANIKCHTMEYSSSAACLFHFSLDEGHDLVTSVSLQADLNKDKDVVDRRSQYLRLLSVCLPTRASSEGL